MESGPQYSDETCVVVPPVLGQVASYSFCCTCSHSQCAIMSLLVASQRGVRAATFLF